ncbi:PQQ-dependent sugar dehydrogenase [Halomarina salina]|uniref:PQQ-dependent sugar dehydrogenase n=1 Tax=Halomarina salina TaxID=1872699 RepID=A0ABD5RN19_9EURY|nr:PQQ-dependent sugar dehydrogenase [Halomarina salina]
MDRRTYLRVAGTGVLAGLAGCSGIDGGTDPGPTATDTDGATGTDGTVTTTAGDGQRVVAETVATGLDVPWGVAFPGDDPAEVYLTERPGRVVRLRDGERTVLADLTSTGATGEGGLMGLALHPEDQSIAFTCQTYTADGETRNRVLRHDTDDDWNFEPVFEGIPGARYHDGGRLLVWDGALYVTAGDATVADLAQDPERLNGSVLRLAFDGEPHPDNPDVGHPAVFTYGHRNPQGLAVKGGALYQTEHGPDTDDEVNRLEAGGNYGWPVVRGVESGDDDQFVPALASYTPTIAPAGLAVYPTDGAVRAWRGDLLFGTLSGTHLHRVRLDEDDEVVEDERLFEGEFGRLRTTSIGPDGHLYATTSNRDGRGSPSESDDRLLRFRPAEGE